MCDDQDSGVLFLVVADDLFRTGAYSVPDASHSFAAWEFDVDPSAQIFPASVEIGFCISDFVPQRVFVIAEMVFTKAGVGLDLEVGMMSGDRVGGVNRSLEVARIDGVEFRACQSFAQRFGLLSAQFRQRCVEVTMSFVVDVALRLAMTYQGDGAWRGIDDEF